MYAITVKLDGYFQNSAQHEQSFLIDQIFVSNGMITFLLLLPTERMILLRDLKFYWIQIWK